MSLLFDANLSPRLVALLADVFPNSRHVVEIGLTTSDGEIWKSAVDWNLAIVSKDADFSTLAILAPEGKAILVSIGNCTTSEVEKLLRSQHTAIRDFLANQQETLLVLSTTTS